ncbi:alpha/beta hydrolase [Novosphingobium bradum]|uniref:Alpha/beta hydrolase n=1 Tax=Novosphingobium bradum TaxID=1737444 RepID=A0ABV7ITQ1_9SPHN
MDLSRRHLAKLALAVAASSAIEPGGVLAQARSARDELWFINPELRGFVKQVKPFIDKMPRFTLANLPTLRKGFTPPQPPLPAVPWEKRVIGGAAGQPDVTVYVINSRPGQLRGGILHTHGGGFVTGNVAGDLVWLQELARAVDCCIVSVDYRLAPETDYRGSTEDNYAGLRWLHRSAESLGIDPARIAVMGESAGGGHAALLALLARDRGEVPLAFQCLTYPMLDDRTGSTRAAPHPIGAFGWSAADNAFGWRSFLGMKPGGRNVPEAAVPARHRDLAGLPPAWIGVGSIDLFVSEDLAYAERLIEAGVAVETLVSPGAFHAFDRFPVGAEVANAFNAARIAALRRALKG